MSESSGRIQLIVLAGPSGAGKTTLVEMLRSFYPEQFSRCVNHTTRAPRDGERNGIDYHFVSREEIEQGIATGQFVEHARVHGNLYGVSTGAIITAAEQGTPLLIVDTQGALTISKVHELAPLFVFITVPSLDDLRERLLARGTDSAEAVETRLKNAIVEMQAVYQPHWHVILKNRKIERCFAELVEVIQAAGVFVETPSFEY